MTKLNQVIAIEKGIKSRAHSVITELHQLSQKTALFEGLTRDYTPKNDGDETLPNEKKIVQQRTKDIIGAARIAWSDVIDITVQKDRANQLAMADVTVDGQKLLGQVPATTLIFLEKQLVDMRTFFEKLPELDIAEAWHVDLHSGLHRTMPVGTTRTKKTQRAIVLYDATDKHPAQTQLINEDVIAGTWNAVRHSGAMPRPEKVGIIARIDKLLIAVKEAREAANAIEAPPRAVFGAAIFEYLLNGQGQKS